MNELNRRNFLLRGAAGLSAAWVTAHWPALLSAATHAHNAAKAATPPRLEFFTPEEAVEIESVTARIIPSDGTPGAREAGVVYFIDRGLATFGVDDQKTYREGLPELQARVSELFAGAAKFSALTTEQQDEVLHSFDATTGTTRRPFRAGAGAYVSSAVRILRQGLSRLATGDEGSGQEMTVDQPRYKTSDEVDFVIIGSGAAGGILAKELSTNGFRVVVLEQGPYLTEADFTHNEIEI